MTYVLGQGGSPKHKKPLLERVDVAISTAFLGLFLIYLIYPSLIIEGVLSLSFLAWLIIDIMYGIKYSKTNLVMDILIIAIMIVTVLNPSITKAVSASMLNTQFVRPIVLNIPSLNTIDIPMLSIELASLLALINLTLRR